MISLSLLNLGENGSDFINSFADAFSLSLSLSGQKSGSNKYKTCSCNSPILTVGNLSSRDLSDEMRPTLHLHLQLCPLVHNSSNSCRAICFSHLCQSGHCNATSVCYLQSEHYWTLRDSGVWVYLGLSKAVPVTAVQRLINKLDGELTKPTHVLGTDNPLSTLQTSFTS